MDPDRHDSDAGDATSPTTPTVAPPQPADDAVIGDAGDANVTALDHGVEYTLTVPQATERFALAKRKVPSDRSIQRYCVDGILRGRKIKTTTTGDDGHRVNTNEWLINQDSLDAYIRKQPMIVNGDAGDATPPPRPPLPMEPSSDSPAIGGAGDARARELAAPIGETRTVAGVLIENSRLLAELDGKEDLLKERDRVIEELRDDRKFLREELTEARNLRGDVKEIAQKMLDTLGAMSLASLGLKQAKADVPSAEIIDNTGGARPL